MTAKLNRLRMLDLALFVLVLGGVAVNTACAAQKNGLDGEGAGAIDGRLSLSLSVSEKICETKRAKEVSGGSSHRDDDGNWVQSKTVFGWTGMSTVRVQWQASGGQEPYSLVIDSIPPYKGRPSSGSSGARMIGCADNSVGIAHEYDSLGIGEPLYRADPQAESGWKTVRAVVTDANGDTAEATVEFYVIRTDAEILRHGQTYRVYGDHLVTAPSSYDVALGSPLEVECPEPQRAPKGYRCEPSFGLLLLPDGHQDDWTTAIAQVNLYVLDGTEESRWRKLSDGTWIEITAAVLAASDEDDPVLAALDEIADSVDDPPRTR